MLISCRCRYFSYNFLLFFFYSCTHLIFFLPQVAVDLCNYRIHGISLLFNEKGQLLFINRFEYKIFFYKHLRCSYSHLRTSLIFTLFLNSVLLNIFTQYLLGSPSVLCFTNTINLIDINLNMTVFLALHVNMYVFTFLQAVTYSHGIETTPLWNSIQSGSDKTSPRR